MIILPLKTQNKSIKHTEKKHISHERIAQRNCAELLNLIKTLTEKHVLQKLCSPLTSTQTVLSFHFFFNMTFLIQVWWSLFHHHISAAVPFLLRTLSICQYNTCLTLRDCERLRNLLIRRGGTKNHQPSINSKEIKRERKSTRLHHETDPFELFERLIVAHFSLSVPC